MPYAVRVHRHSPILHPAALLWDSSFGFPTAIARENALALPAGYLGDHLIMRDFT